MDDPSSDTVGVYVQNMAPYLKTVTANLLKMMIL